jgi:hypothetical protein
VFQNLRVLSGSAKLLLMSNATQAPAGWYDDGTGTSTQRYWDGDKWTDARQPDPNATTLTDPAPAAQTAPSAPVTPPASVAPKERNVLGIVALAVAVVGFIFACVPGALIVGWVLLPIAFILSIVALFLKDKGKALALTALILAVVGTVVGFAVFFSVVANAANTAFGGTTTSKVEQPSTAAKPSTGAKSTSTVGSRTNPAEIGSNIVGQDFTVKINSVNLNATDAVLAASDINGPPDAGDVYAVVNATITYTGAKSGYAAEAPISYVSAGGKVYNSFDKLVVAPDPSFGLDEMYKGASSTGNLVIQIPSAGDGLIRVTPGVLANNVFVKTK